LSDIFRVVEEHQIARPRPIERRDIDDGLSQIHARRRPGAGPFDDFRKGGRHGAAEKFDLVHFEPPAAGDESIFFILKTSELRGVSQIALPAGADMKKARLAAAPLSFGGGIQKFAPPEKLNA
jgi:hypothetical protein